MNDLFKKACTEVLEIISYFPEEEYSKIPNEEIEFLKANMDTNYKYRINPSIDLSEQEISKEANAILVTLFRDYFANDKQKETLKKLLNQNQQILEKQRAEKYVATDIFKNKNITNPTITEKKQETSMVEYKENFFDRFVNFIKKLFKR